MRARAWLAAALASAAAGAWFWPPLVRRTEASGVSLRLPLGWKATAAEAGSGAVLRLEGGPWPALVLEKHPDAKLEPLAYAGTLGGRKEGLAPVKIGPYDAFMASADESSRALREAGASADWPERTRVYIVFRSTGGLYVASYARSRRAWDRWRAENTYRRILSSLKD